MIQVHLAYDLKSCIDEQIYFEWIKQEIIKMFKTQRIVDVCACRNVKGNPEVLVTASFEKVEDWMEFSQCKEWHALLNTLERAFATNLRIEAWKPSPLLPAPLRPPKLD